MGLGFRAVQLLLDHVGRFFRSRSRKDEKPTAERPIASAVEFLSGTDHLSYYSWSRTKDKQTYGRSK